MSKSSKISAVIRGKCPRCHEGDLFLNKNPYRLKNMGKMHDRCSRCGQNFNPEPGFYFGAGYVSYAISVAISIGIFFILFPRVGWTNAELYVIVIGSVLLALAPVILRLSRAGWIAFFYRYDENAIKKYREKNHEHPRV